MNPLKQDITRFKEDFSQELANVISEQDLETLRVKFLSRKGILATLMQQLKTMPLEQKQTIGPLLNELKQWAQDAFDSKQQSFVTQKISQEKLKKQYFDVTAYDVQQLKGSLHPYTQMVQHLEDVFISMGYDIADGPELETDYYNFQALNIPEDHPARDLQDTFWLELPRTLMRTHTSNVQIHVMENKKPPIAIFSPGRAYRHEATDPSHDFMFMQAEGLLIDKDISMSHLFATAQECLQAIFEKKDLNIRIRPGYFPFVEPGLEIDISCPFCEQGCSVCKKTRWIEACGAGLVHPNVLQCSGIDSKSYSGFAFGFGLTRLVMLKHRINDVRLLHSGKVKFLEQF